MLTVFQPAEDSQITRHRGARGRWDKSWWFISVNYGCHIQNEVYDGQDHSQSWYLADTVVWSSDRERSALDADLVLRTDWLECLIMRLRRCYRLLHKAVLASRGQQFVQRLSWDPFACCFRSFVCLLWVCSFGQVEITGQLLQNCLRFALPLLVIVQSLG